ncbi:ATP-binding protein [Streptomyces sp. NPDC050636]|uniref:ATP-binding protein n=1 Tax=Streptomyces sp. NPDC050636 TaxID=3154510 RepID=UPI00341C12FF
MDSGTLKILASPAHTSTPPFECTVEESARRPEGSTHSADESTRGPKLTTRRPPSHPAATPAPTDWGLAMGLGVPRFTARRFTPCPAGLQRIRHHTRITMQKWGLSSCSEDAVMVVNELVTNALRHGLSRQPSADVGWLGLMHTANTVTCTVKDSSTAIPTTPPTHLLAAYGRGLRIVNTLSCSWGYSIADGPGKTVWARLPAGNIADHWPQA